MNYSIYFSPSREAKFRSWDRPGGRKLATRSDYVPHDAVLKRKIAKFRLLERTTRKALAALPVRPYTPELKVLEIANSLSYLPIVSCWENHMPPPVGHALRLPWTSGRRGLGWLGVLHHDPIERLLWHRLAIRIPTYRKHWLGSLTYGSHIDSSEIDLIVLCHHVSWRCAVVRNRLPSQYIDTPTWEQAQNSIAVEWSQGYRHPFFVYLDQIK